MLTKVDIKAGDMTLAQRSELGAIVSSDMNELGKFNAVFECLHDFTPRQDQYEGLIDYFKEILEGILFWAKVESTELKFEPTAKERQAGIEKLNENMGCFGVADSIGQRYSIDPDEVMQWKYSKVFLILVKDYREEKFKRKLRELGDRPNQNLNGY
jgi:hypothetical protein